jgi:hypothetical protein
MSLLGLSLPLLNGLPPFNHLSCSFKILVKSVWPCKLKAPQKGGLLGFSPLSLLSNPPLTVGNLTHSREVKECPHDYFENALKISNHGYTMMTHTKYRKLGNKKIS